MNVEHRHLAFGIVTVAGACLNLVTASGIAQDSSEKIPDHLNGLTRISFSRVVISPYGDFDCAFHPDLATPAGPHNAGAVLVYTNGKVLDYRRAHPKAHDYPVGSVFLKEKYAGIKAPKPHLATVMKRVADKGEGIKDWKFSVISLPSGDTPKMGKEEARCADCHAGFKRRGFVSPHSEQAILAFLKKPAGGRRPNADSKGFLELGAKAEKLREQRLLSAEDFVKMAKREGTVVLDARSRSAFDKQRIAGSVNLPYTDFTPDALAKVIPSKDTAVLIYCSNNINHPAAKGSAAKGKVLVGGGFKGSQAALTIPTFITLYGYGYRNLYELGPSVVPGESVIDFVAEE